MALEMALEITRQQPGKDVTIFSDSQAAIKAIGGSQASGQQIIGGIIDSCDNLRKRGARVTIHWSPAHQGIPGNEQAEKKAKEATGWRLSRDARGRNVQVDTDATAPALGDLKQPLSTFKRKLKTLAHTRWDRSWQKETRGRILFRIVDKPAQRIMKLHNKLTRPFSSVLTQMRTGHIGLRHFLYSRRVPEVEDGICQCQQGEQTVAHILLSCSSFKRARDTMWKRAYGQPI